MRKKVVMGFLFTLLIFTAIISVSAATNSTDEQQKINDAYQCLRDKAGNGTDVCSTFSTEEQIFSLLADNLCHSQLVDDSSNESQCWPSGSCKVKTTAQAVLALDNSGTNTDKAQDWLKAQNRTPTDLAWYLEIESTNPSTCTISYSGRDYNVNIGEDKKISNNAGACLVLSQDDYWLRVAPSCYDEEFEVSCTENFLTTLLFKETTSSTIHVSDKSSSAAAGGSTTEQVDSYCLADGNVCSYEGTLWAALVLDSLGNDVSSYMPYLITLADDNQKYLPESFLYFITADEKYRTSLLAGQKNGGWWIESGDKFYDSALALYPFQSEDLPEKANAKDWLFNVQGENGCWENSVRDTAFLLASLYPESFSTGSGGSGGETGLDCESYGYYCVPSGSAVSGEILSEYDCPALYKCSTSPVEQQTCSELGGELCSSSQVCQGGTIISSGDSSFGESCCIQGSCAAAPATTQSECELSGGICRSYGCGDGEASSTAACDFSGDTCCITSNTGGSSSGGGAFWLWFFLILIVLVVVGIMFREKLRIYWLKMKSGLGSGKGHSSSGPGPRRFGPPTPPHGPMPMRRPFPERRILLPGTQAPSRPRPSPSKPASRSKSGAQKELDDVLKKLKDMGK